MAIIANRPSLGTAKPEDRRPHSDPNGNGSLEGLLGPAAGAQAERSRDELSRRSKVMKRTLMLGVLALTALLVFMGTDTLAKKPPKPPPSDPDPAIAFTGSGEVVVMNADGSNETVVVSGGGDLCRPSWSPDGTQIAFGGNMNGKGVHVVNLDGTGLTTLVTTNDKWIRVAWSPAKVLGTKEMIAYVDTPAGENFNDLFLVCVDGSCIYWLTGTSCRDEGSVAWAPEAGRLAVLEWSNGAYRLVVLTLCIGSSGGIEVCGRLNLTTALADGGSYGHPDWARTSDRIVVQNLSIIDFSDLDNIVRISPSRPTGYDRRNLSWSPDDSQVVYWRAYVGGSFLRKKAICVSTLAGSEWVVEEIKKEGGRTGVRRTAWRRNP
jgi:hypothetical protein